MLGTTGTGLSGHNFDAFVSSTQTPDGQDWAAKVQEKYWLARQKFLSKIEKREDSGLVLSDSKLDAKLEVYRTINRTCSEMVDILENYLNSLYLFANEKNAFGGMIKEFAKLDPSKAGKVMQLLSKGLIQSSHQAIKLYMPLLRFHQEFETFYAHACDDTRKTIDQLESQRDLYRASLLWMKDVSDKLDPDVYRRLNKFRLVQNKVRKDKKDFDCLKMNVVQKVDLLMASRCNLVNHTLAGYQQTMCKMFAKNLELFQGIEKLIQEQNIDAECIPNFLKLKKDTINSPHNDEDAKTVTSSEAEPAAEAAAALESPAIVEQPTTIANDNDLLIDYESEMSASADNNQHADSSDFYSYAADMLELKSSGKKLLNLDLTNSDEDQEQVVANLLAPSNRMSEAMKKPSTNAGELLNLNDDLEASSHDLAKLSNYSSLLSGSTFSDLNIDVQQSSPFVSEIDNSIPKQKQTGKTAANSENLIDIDDDDFILKQLDLINDQPDSSLMS